MQPHPWRSWLRDFLERGCFVGWMVLTAATTVVVGLAAELLIFGTILSFAQIALINEHTAPLLVAGVFATLLLPLAARLRAYGVEYLHFETHEGAFNRFVEPPESWSSAILTLLDAEALRGRELETLVRLIEEAPGPLERQDRRSEAKAWLQTHRDELTDEELDFVRCNLGYLL